MATAQQTSRQHLISQVLLKQFAMPGPTGSGWQLLPFDLRDPGRLHKRKSTRACGWAESFVAFDSDSASASASASAEELWCDVERGTPEAFSAVHADTPFADPLHVAALRDLVVLHNIRSQPPLPQCAHPRVRARPHAPGGQADQQVSGAVAPRGTA